MLRERERRFNHSNKIFRLAGDRLRSRKQEAGSGKREAGKQVGENPEREEERRSVLPHLV
jgi:hypothetical protein